MPQFLSSQRSLSLSLSLSLSHSLITNEMNNLMTKSFLSYQDLKKEALKDLESGGSNDININPSSSIELSSTAAAAAHDDNLRRFFEDAGLVKDEMSSIRSLLTNLQSLREESKSLHNPDHLKSHRARINSDIVSVLKQSRSIKARLESMDRANAANRRLSGFREGTPVDRTRSSVTNGLRLKLKELMMEFQDLRQRMMSEYKETVERRYYTLTGEVLDEDTFEKMLASGDSGEDLLKRAVLEEQGKERVVETVVEIQGRHDAAEEIERSLLELHQVFLDMVVMVEAQGERMDDIEHHVVSASHYVKGGAKELGAAKGYQRSSRKWMCVGIVMLLLILVLAILVPILASLSKS